MEYGMGVRFLFQVKLIFTAEIKVKSNQENQNPKSEWRVVILLKNLQNPKHDTKKIYKHCSCVTQTQ